MSLGKQDPPLRLRSLTDSEREAIGKERRAQGPVLGYSRAIADSDGNIGAPLVALSTLALMERKGTITAAQRQAGDEFHRIFRLASLDALRAPDMSRTPVDGGGHSNEVSGNEHARKRISRMMTRLGGAGSVVASAAWHVLGLEWSLRQFAARSTGANVHQASGVLLAALVLIEKEF